MLLQLKLKRIMKKLLCILLFASMLSVNEAYSQPVPQSTLNQEQVKFLERMISEGVLSFRFYSHEAYLSLFLWNDWSADTKESMVNAFAIYCAIKNSEKISGIVVFDKQSGKKIAKLDVWGYKVY